ncbi:hypothetical protein [Terricaulis sp.]|uniref:hypothetical protein n=1 Tax=Terricaulis sp. TaxID=2768686 RepID=UPI002AC7D503|nr:hypothetical protein [Terricaulis sp.]MDZ4691334.1 hypothetical protein [Terricaulis sp.]
MQDFVLSGRAVDVVLLVIVIEFVVLVSLRAGQRRRAAVDLFFALMPGAILLLAIRAALVGAEWPWVALLIAASFPFHLIDLMRRR